MTMPLTPKASELRDIGTKLGVDYSEADIDFIGEAIGPFVAAANAAMRLPDNLPVVTYPRTPGWQPEAEDNPLNGWYWRTEIKGAPEGPLSGKTVALKDNVLLAGVPMMNGASMWQHYVPEADATVVTRLLDAGATITGKAHCEYFCLSGSSHSNALGPCHNPVKHGYSAGGSSSGSAALVGAGAADLAIGGDQGGSIRMPASFCGIVGLKPTHSLVPYTGICSMEVSIDHAGPMTRTVADNAAMLEAIAGPDGWDARQQTVTVHPYTEALEKGVEGLRIGVVKQGFGLPESMAEVDSAVFSAVEAFSKMGAEISEISVPAHTGIGDIFMPMIAEGMVRQLTFGGGLGSGAYGFYPRSLLEKNLATADRGNEFPDTVLAMATFGAWVMEKYGGRVYAKGQNLRPYFRAQYAKVFEGVDLLLMPTTPMTAMKLPDAETSREDWLQQAWCMLANTSPYDYTGHPAISLPCGMTSEGLPVGLQLVGRHFDEPSIYRAAAAFENAHGVGPGGE
ncbi:MAG: amidase [Pseudomonadota bacterium]